MNFKFSIFFTKNQFQKFSGKIQKTMSIFKSARKDWEFKKYKNLYKKNYQAREKFGSYRIYYDI